MLAATLAILACRAEPATEVAAPRSGADAPAGQRREADAEEPELAPGSSFERRLAGGERHGYALELAAGDYLHLVVEQNGIDVVAALIGAGGAALEVDSPTGARGPETLFLVAPAAGRYRLEVRGSPGAPGGYAVRIEAWRPATAPDRERAAALEVFAGAENLRRERTPEAYRAALEPYRAAARRWAAADETIRQALALRQVGRMHELLGEAQQAIRWYRRSVELQRSSGAAGAELAATLRRLGTLHRSLGEESAALDSLEAALELARELGDGRWEAASLHNIALTYKRFGHPQRALDFYEQARDRWRALGHAHPAEEAETLSNLGALYTSLGAFDRARILLEEALPLSLRSGDRRVEAWVRSRLGAVLVRLDRPRPGLGHLERSLALGESTRNRLVQAASLRELARARFELGEPAAALRLDQRALGLFRDLGRPAEQAGVASDLGWFLVETGDPERALAYLEDALRLHRLVGSRRGEASALHAAARAERRRGETRAARRRIEQALEIVESLRTRTDVLELRASYLAGKQDYYELYLDLLVELYAGDPAAGYDGLAFEANQRRRARALLDVLLADRGELGQDGGEALAAEERALRRAIDARGLERGRLLEGGAPPAEVAPVERRLEELLMARESLRARAAAVPAAAPPPALGLRQAQALIDADTVVLEIALGETRSFLWSVTPDTSRLHELPPRSEIEELARETYRLLAGSRDRRQRGRLRLVAGELSRMLLGPVAGGLGKQRLVVVGDGALLHVPFAALPIPRGHPAASGGAGQDLMLRWHEVVQVPSLPVLAALRRRPPAPEAGFPGRGTSGGVLAVVADPVLGLDDPRLATPGAGLARAGPVTPLRRLDGAGDEAAAILALVPEAERLAVLGFDASRQTVVSGVLGNYRFVHFATHGLFDPARPELSGLVLSRLDPRGQPRDGWILRPHEVIRLDLPVEMVVLSACRTGLGREVRGEGLVGLTQAFFHAGAARVLVSFWPVDDRATAALMERLYRGILQDGLRPAAALRSAQLSMLGETPWQAPYYWAGFFFQGEWR